MRCGHLTCDPCNIHSLHSLQKQEWQFKNSGFFLIHSPLSDKNRSFCCQVNGNIMLSQCFDDMRLLSEILPSFRSDTLYSYLSNKRVGSNKQVGWTISSNLINGQALIKGQAGIFLKYNKRVGLKVYLIRGQE